MIKDKEKLEKKLTKIRRKLDDTRKDNDEIEKLKQNYTTNLKLSADCDLHVEKLQKELTEAKELANQLQTALDSNTQVDSLQQALKDETELTAQLKTALDAKQRHIEKVEESSLEANNNLEEKVKEYEKGIVEFKNHYKLSRAKTSL